MMITQKKLERSQVSSSNWRFFNRFPNKMQKKILQLVLRTEVKFQSSFTMAARKSGSNLQNENSQIVLLTLKNAQKVIVVQDNPELFRADK